MSSVVVPHDPLPLPPPRHPFEAPLASSADLPTSPTATLAAVAAAAHTAAHPSLMLLLDALFPAPIFLSPAERVRCAVALERIAITPPPPQQEGTAEGAPSSPHTTRKTVVLSATGGTSDKADGAAKAEDTQRLKENDEVNERLLRKEEKEKAKAEKKAAKQKNENSLTPQFPSPSSSVVVAHHRSAPDAVDAASRFILAKRLGVRPIPRRTPTPPLPADDATEGTEPSTLLLSSKQKKKNGKTGLSSAGDSSPLPPPPLPLPAEALLFPPRDPQEQKFRGNSCNAAEAEKLEMQRLLQQLARQREREEAEAEAEEEEGRRRGHRRSSSTCSGQQRQRQRHRHRVAAATTTAAARAQLNHTQNKQQKAAAAVTTTAAVPEAFDVFRHEEYEHMCAPIVMDTSLPDYYTNSYACCWPAAALSPSQPSPLRDNSAVNNDRLTDDDVGEAVAEDEKGAVPSRFVAPGGVPKQSSLGISGVNKEEESRRQPLLSGDYAEGGSPATGRCGKAEEIEEDGEEEEEDLLAVLAKSMAYSAALEAEVSRGFAFIATGDDANDGSVAGPTVAAAAEGLISPADSVTAVAGGLRRSTEPFLPQPTTAPTKAKGKHAEEKAAVKVSAVAEKHIHFNFTTNHIFNDAKESGERNADTLRAAGTGSAASAATNSDNNSDSDAQRSLRLRSLLAEQHPPAPQMVCARALTSEAARWADGAGIGAGGKGFGGVVGIGATPAATSSAPNSRPFTPMPPPSLPPSSLSACVPPPLPLPPKVIIPLLAIMPTQQQQNLVSSFPIADRRRQQQQQLGIQCTAAASVVGCQGGGGGGGVPSPGGMSSSSAWPTPIPTPPPQFGTAPHPHKGMGGDQQQKSAKTVAAEEREWRQAYRRWRRRRERRHRRLIARLFLGNSGGGEPLLKWYSQHPAQAAEAKAVIAAASYSHLFPSSQPSSQEEGAAGIGGGSGGGSAAQSSPPLLVLPLTRTAALTPLSFLYPALVPSAPNVPLPLPCAQSAPPPLSVDFSSASTAVHVASSAGDNTPASTSAQQQPLTQQKQLVLLASRRTNGTDGDEQSNEPSKAVGAVGVCPFWTHSFGAQKRFHTALGLCVAQRNAAAALRRLLFLQQQQSSNAPRGESSSSSGNRELPVNSTPSSILASLSSSSLSSAAHFDSYYSYHNTSPMGDPFTDLIRLCGADSDSISVQTRAQYCAISEAEAEEERRALAANPLHDRFFAAHPPLRLPTSTNSSSGPLPSAPLPPPPLLNGAVNILCPRRNLLFVAPLTLWHSGGDTATPTATTAQSTCTMASVLSLQHGQNNRHDVPSAAHLNSSPPLAPFTRSYLSSSAAAAAAAAATSLQSAARTSAAPPFDADRFFSTIADANAHRPLGALAHYRRKAFDRSPADCGAAGVLDMLKDLMEEAEAEEEKEKEAEGRRKSNGCEEGGAAIPYLHLSVAVSREAKPTVGNNGGGVDEPPTLRIAEEDENEEEEACREDVPSAIATGDIATAGAPKQEEAAETTTAATSSFPPPPLASFLSLLAELRAVCLGPLVPQAYAATAAHDDGRVSGGGTNRCAIPTAEAPMVDSTHELTLLKDLSHLHFRSPPFAYPPALLPAPPSFPASSAVASAHPSAATAPPPAPPFPPHRRPFSSPTSTSNPLLSVLADTLPLLGGDVLPDIGPMAVEGLPLWGTGVIFVEAPRVRRVFFGNGGGGAKVHSSKGFEAAEAKVLRRLRKERAEMEKKKAKKEEEKRYQEDDEGERTALKRGGDTVKGVRNSREREGYDSGDGNAVCSCAALCPSAKECADFAAVNAKKRVFGPTASATHKRPVTTAGAQRHAPSDHDDDNEGEGNEVGTEPFLSVEERAKKTKRKEEKGKDRKQQQEEKERAMEEEAEKKALFASAHQAALQREAAARATAVRAEAAVAWAWQRQWLRYATGAAASLSYSCIISTAQNHHQQQTQNQKRRAVGDDGAFAASSPLSAALLAGMSPNFAAASPKPRAKPALEGEEETESFSFLDYLLVDADSSKGSDRKSRNIPQKQQQLQSPPAPLSLPSVFISEAEECVVIDLFSTLWRPLDILRMRAEVLVLEQDLIACLVAAAVLMQTPSASSSDSPSSVPKFSCRNSFASPTLPTVDEEARRVGITLREAFAAEEKLRIKNSGRKELKVGGGCCVCHSSDSSGGDNSPFSSTVTGDGRNCGLCCTSSSSTTTTKKKNKKTFPSSDGEDAHSPDYLLPLTPSPPLAAPPQQKTEYHRRSQQSAPQFLSAVGHLFTACPAAEAATASCVSQTETTKSAPSATEKKKKQKRGGSPPKPSLLLAVNHLFHQKRLQRCADLRQQLANAAKYCRDEAVAAALQQKSDGDVLSEVLLMHRNSYLSEALARDDDTAVGTCGAHNNANAACRPTNEATNEAAASGALALVASLYGPLVRSALAETNVGVGAASSDGGNSSGHSSFPRGLPAAGAFLHDVLSDAVACTAVRGCNTNTGEANQTKGVTNTAKTTAYPADVKKNRKQRDKANAKRRAAKQRPEPDQFIRVKLRNASVEMMPSRFYFFPHKTIEEAQQHAAFLATEREREKEMEMEEEERERARDTEKATLRQMNKSEEGETAKKCTFAGDENPPPASAQPQSHPHRTHHRRSFSVSAGSLRHPFSGSLPTPSASVVNAALASITSAAATAPSLQPQLNSGLNSPTAATSVVPTPTPSGAPPRPAPRNRRQRSLSPLSALSVSAGVGGRFHRSLSLSNHFHFHSDRPSEPQGGGGEAGAAVEEVARGRDTEIGGLEPAASVSVVGPLALISAALHDGVRRGGDESLLVQPPTVAKSPSRSSAAAIGSAQRSPSKMVASERRRRGRSASISKSGGGAAGLGDQTERVSVSPLPPETTVFTEMVVTEGEEEEGRIGIRTARSESTTQRRPFVEERVRAAAADTAAAAQPVAVVGSSSEHRTATAPPPPPPFPSFDRSLLPSNVATGVIHMCAEGISLSTRLNALLPCPVASSAASSSSSSGAAVEVYKLKVAINAIDVALSEYGAGNAKGAAAGALAAVLGPIVKAIVLRQIRKRAEGKRHFL